MENYQDKQSLTLPKNIRQIGNFGDTYKIYVEDFVFTYVHQFLHEKKEENTVLAAVLLGEIKKENNKEYIFISGAQKCNFKISPEEETREDATDKQQEFWSSVYQGIKEYFSDKEILGWYINLDGSGLEINSQLQQFFEATYSRGSRFLYYEDSLERMDAFFVQEQHVLQRISGYAVYYEKNQQMQEFMISEKERRNPRPSAPTSFSTDQEDVASNYRAIMNKLNEKPKKRRIQPAIYVAGVAVLAIVTATGIAQIGNYQNLRVLENTLQTLSGAVGKTSGETTDGSAVPESDQQSAQKENKENTKVENPPEDKVEDPPKEHTEAPDEAQKTSTDVAEQQTASKEETPEKTEEATVSKEESASASANVKPDYYTVKRGDSLVSISKQFYQNVNMVDKICELNKIENMDVIYEGQKLRLP